MLRLQCNVELKGLRQIKALGVEKLLGRNIVIWEWNCKSPKVNP